MTTPMIEKMARAIYEDQQQRVWQDGWTAVPEIYKRDFYRTARAALTALLEPTDEMLHAGCDFNHMAACQVFTSMIQAALNQKED